MAWIRWAGGTFVARITMDGLELAPPRVAGEIFGDAALPPATDNQPSLLETLVRVAVPPAPVARRRLQLKAVRTTNLFTK